MANKALVSFPDCRTKRA